MFSEFDYERTIVCDIDNTLSFTTNRDWENAKPNVSLIKKLNRLFENGWKINLLTARGSISCKSRIDADKKYRNIIETWLKNNNVKYTSLSFEKPLAAYYIDDKGITPEDFENVEIEILNGGLNHQLLEKRDDKVFKAANNTKMAVKWFNRAKYFFNVPKIYSVIGNTISMEYIKSNDVIKFNDITTIIDNFKLIKTETANFSTYIKHLQKHFTGDCWDSEFIEWINIKLEQIGTKMDEEKSFSHGDLTIDNMLKKDDKVYLIDPNYYENNYSSWLLDISKMVQSCYRFNKKDLLMALYNKYDNIKEIIELLELTHWIRMIKYIPIENQELKQLSLSRINELKEKHV